MNKLQKTAKGLDTFLKISFWANVILAVLLAVGEILLCILYITNPDAISQASSSLDFGVIQFIVDPAVPHTAHSFIVQLIVLSLIGNAELIVWCLFIRSGRKILAPMIAGQTFHSQMSQQLKRMGWLNITLGILQNVSQFFMFGNLITGYDLDALFLNEGIIAYELQFNLDLSFLLWSFVLFLLSYVFKHGWELQQLSDETL